jgi:hypothetical protein
MVAVQGMTYVSHGQLSTPRDDGLRPAYELRLVVARFTTVCFRGQSGRDRHTLSSSVHGPGAEVAAKFAAMRNGLGNDHTSALLRAVTQEPDLNRRAGRHPVDLFGQLMGVQ